MSLSHHFKVNGPERNINLWPLQGSSMDWLTPNSIVPIPDPYPIMLTRITFLGSFPGKTWGRRTHTHTDWCSWSLYSCPLHWGNYNNLQMYFCLLHGESDIIYMWPSRVHCTKCRSDVSLHKITLCYNFCSPDKWLNIYICTYISSIYSIEFKFSVFFVHVVLTDLKKP